MTGGVALPPSAGRAWRRRPAWDGKIVVGGRRFRQLRVGVWAGCQRALRRAIGMETMELVQRQMADSMGADSCRRVWTSGDGLPVKEGVIELLTGNDED